MAAEAAWPLQERIDDIAAKGGGTLTLTSGVYRTGALFFKEAILEIAGRGTRPRVPADERRSRGDRPTGGTKLAFFGYPR